VSPICEALVYRARFVHSRTTKTLHSEIVRVRPKGQKVSIGDRDVHLSLPAPGSSVTGVILSGPCSPASHESAEPLATCPGGPFVHPEALSHLARALDQLLASGQVHFWGLLGDLFRDQNTAERFFGHLSVEAKSKLFMAAPGGRDFWSAGEPPGVAGDELGFGFMQFYGQDTVAATLDSPYDFSSVHRHVTNGTMIGGYGIAPIKAQTHEVAPAEDFIFGVQIGDLAFFGYSGAHPWPDTEPHAASFCNFVGTTTSVRAVVVLGRWDHEGGGCSPGMDVPSVRARMGLMPGCTDKPVLRVAPAGSGYDCGDIDDFVAGLTRPRLLPLRSHGLDERS